MPQASSPDEMVVRNLRNALLSFWLHRFRVYVSSLPGVTPEILKYFYGVEGQRAAAAVCDFAMVQLRLHTPDDARGSAPHEPDDPPGPEAGGEQSGAAVRAAKAGRGK